MNAEEYTSNPEGLRVIKRDVAAAVIISSDGKIVMGRKDPNRGGVYPNAWHIPGGGVEDGESEEEAASREILEEVGLDISDAEKRPLPAGRGTTYKTLEGGERVWCEMTFNRFEVRLPQTGEELIRIMKPGDDLVEVRCFSREELEGVEQIPGGKEFFREMGYVD